MEVKIMTRIITKRMHFNHLFSFSSSSSVFHYLHCYFFELERVLIFKLLFLIVFLLITKSHHLPTLQFSSLFPQLELASPIIIIALPRNCWTQLVF